MSISSRLTMANMITLTRTKIEFLSHCTFGLYFNMRLLFLHQFQTLPVGMVEVPTCPLKQIPLLASQL